MNYTEEDLRKAFQAGMNKGSHQSYFDAPLDEDEYIESLKQGQSLPIDSVSQQRELLIDFSKHIFNTSFDEEIDVKDVDDYLKSINCG